MIQLTDNVWAVQIPKGANGFTMSKEFNALTYYAENPSFESIRTVNLPPGQWEFICTSKDATEEQAASVIERLADYQDKKLGALPSYLNYAYSKKDDWYGCFPFPTAVLSLESLLKSKGLEGNYALLKKL